MRRSLFSLIALLALGGEALGLQPLTVDGSYVAGTGGGALPMYRSAAAVSPATMPSSHWASAEAQRAMGSVEPERPLTTPAIAMPSAADPRMQAPERGVLPQARSPLATEAVTGTLPQPRFLAPIGTPPAAREVVQPADPIRLPLGLALDEPLAPFGYEFFAAGPQPPFETSLMAIPADYPIGPGDAFTVHVWTKVTDETFTAEVGREGRISIPRQGEIFVMGVRYGELAGVLRTELSRVMADANVSVNLIRLRSFQVLVTGEVRSPGPVAVNALNTALNALMAAGGPNARGSLRQIAVRRGAKTAATIDLYDLLLSGTIANDPLLQPGDVVFVPVIGRTAAVLGMVKRPAVYELSEGATLASLVRAAGGLTPSAYTSRIVVYRNKDGAVREIKDIKADRNWEARAEKVLLRDGDVVHVPRMSTTVSNAVTLRGNVERPGEYEWHKGMRVRDLVRQGRKLLPGTLMGRAEILRVRKNSVRMTYNAPVPTETVRELLTVHLGRAMDGALDDNLLLEPNDDVHVLGIRAGGPPPQVSVIGEVTKPGDYELAAGMRVRDLVFMAGNIRVAAELARAELVRRLPGGGEQILPVRIGEALVGNERENVLLQNFDVLTIHADPSLVEKLRVRVSGEVRYPGDYMMHRGDRLSTVLKRAGGLTPQAFLPGAVFTRLSVKARQEEQKQRFILEQRKIIAGERAQALRLPDGARPLTDPAAALGDAESLVGRLEQAPVSGRLSLRLLPPGELEGAAEDIPLEDGDALAIPREPSEITVAGEVFTPGSFLYKPGSRVANYLALAGGTTARAWRKQAFLLHPDGSAASASQDSSAGRSGWDGLHLGVRGPSSRAFFDLPVIRGDAIFVPSDYRVRRDRAGEIIDRVYKVAISVGALAAVFN